MLWLLSLTCYFFFFFNDTATTEIYTLSLHDALPISPVQPPWVNPPSVSSSLPPGACMTPSRVTNSCTMSFRTTAFLAFGCRRRYTNATNGRGENRQNQVQSSPPDPLSVPVLTP